MTPQLISLVGQEFGLLTVLERDLSKTTKVYWHCICECGERRSVYGGSLKNGEARSCGCRGKATGGPYEQHGGKYTSEYAAWQAMKDRCYNSAHPAFYNWGGRGITVCQAWLKSFAQFLQDMGPKPTAEHTLDRIDNNGDYEPGNCRWATWKEQANNKRRRL